MKKTLLQRKTPLKAKTGLKRKTELKAKTGLTKTELKRSSTPIQRTTSIKVKQKTARKLKEPYRSIFTENLDICVITGGKATDPHHIFGGRFKTLSEKYGFILPLRHDWHTGTNYCIHKDTQLSLKYKLLCEEYYINVLHKTREEWIGEFGKWWIAEKVA